MIPPCGYQNWWQRLRGGLCWRPAEHNFYDKDTMTEVNACTKRRHYAAYLTRVAQIKEAQPL